MAKFLLIVLLLIPTNLLAQPPDNQRRVDIQPRAETGNCPAGTNNGTVRSGVPFRIYWCSPARDQLEGAKISGLPAGTFQLDNVRIERGPFTGDNMTQWSAAVPAQPRGNYTIIIIAQNYRIPGDANTLQESPGSAPFALGVADGVDPPTAPTRIRVDPGNPTR